MIRKSLSLVALWLVLTAPAFGADTPKLSVTGGKVLVIDAIGLPADTIKEFTPIDAGDGKWIVILSTASSSARNPERRCGDSERWASRR
jgi:hypothetical protein